MTAGLRQIPEVGLARGVPFMRLQGERNRGGQAPNSCATTTRHECHRLGTSAGRRARAHRSGLWPGVGAQKSAETTACVGRHDVRAMLEHPLLLLSLARAAMRDREALIAENL